MIHFSQCLREVVGTARGTQIKLAKETGVHPGNVSRWYQAKSLPDRDVLGRMLESLDESDSARLAVAWARDQLPAKARELVVVMERDPAARLKEEPDDWPEGVNAASRRKFVDFAKIATDYPDVMKVVDVLHQAAARLQQGR